MLKNKRMKKQRKDIATPRPTPEDFLPRLAYVDIENESVGEIDTDEDPGVFDDRDAYRDANLDGVYYFI